MTFALTSSAFTHEGVIPKIHTGEGDNRSPELSWTGAPEGTVAFALICEDPDAPTRANPRPEGPWVHWLIWNIPGDATGLPEGVPRDATVESLAGAAQGANSWPSDNLGHLGPMPPPGSGPHRYFFTVYALSAKLDLAPGADKAALLAAIEGKSLGDATLMGTYERAQ